MHRCYEGWADQWFYFFYKEPKLLKVGGPRGGPRERSLTSIDPALFSEYLPQYCGAIIFFYEIRYVSQQGIYCHRTTGNTYNETLSGPNMLMDGDCAFYYDTSQKIENFQGMIVCNIDLFVLKKVLRMLISERTMWPCNKGE